MAYPTLTEVFDGIRVRLNDLQVTGGEQYPNSALLLPAQQAYREYYRVLRALGVPPIVSQFIYPVPAHTSTVTPLHMGLENLLASLLSLEDGTPGTGIAVASCSYTASPGSVLTVNTSSPHGITQGGYYVLSGVTPASANNQLFVATTVPSTTQLTTSNSVVTGTGSTGGTLYPATNQWSQVTPAINNRLSSTPAISLERISEYSWSDNVLCFHPVSTIRLLRIYYLSAKPAPTQASDSLPDPDILDYLITRGGALAAKNKGMSEYAVNLNLEAVGRPDGVLNEVPDGGILRQRLADMVRQMQAHSIYRPRYRPVRSPSRGSGIATLPIF